MCDSAQGKMNGSRLVNTPHTNYGQETPHTSIALTLLFVAYVPLSYFSNQPAAERAHGRAHGQAPGRSAGRHGTAKMQPHADVTESPCMAIQFIELQMLGYTKLHHF